MEGVLFSDYGTDLGSGPTVPGRILFVSVFLVALFFSKKKSFMNDDSFFLSMRMTNNIQEITHNFKWMSSLLFF